MPSAAARRTYVIGEFFPDPDECLLAITCRSTGDTFIPETAYLLEHLLVVCPAEFPIAQCLAHDFAQIL